MLHIVNFPVLEIDHEDPDLGTGGEIQSQSRGIGVRGDSIQIIIKIFRQDCLWKGDIQNESFIEKPCILRRKLWDHVVGDKLVLLIHIYWSLSASLKIAFSRSYAWAGTSNTIKLVSKGNYVGCN